MNHREGYRQVSDGLKLYYQGWEPETPPKAAILLVHGLGEHSSRYQHVAEWMTKHGFAMLAFDYHGHGRSEGTRGHASYQTVLEDIQHFLDFLSQEYAGRDHFLYGHSLGGALVLAYLLKHRPNLRGAIVTSPGLGAGEPVHPALLALARVLAKLWPTMPVPYALDRNNLSRIPEVVQKYNRDPLVHDKISARLSIDIIEGGKQILSSTAQLPVPVLLMQGSADHVVSPPLTRALAARAGSDITYVEWPNLFHEIHNEPEQKEVLDTMTRWMQDRIQARE